MYLVPVKGIPFVKIADRVEATVNLKGERVSGRPSVFKQIDRLQLQLMPLGANTSLAESHIEALRRNFSRAFRTEGSSDLFLCEKSQLYPWDFQGSAS